VHLVVTGDKLRGHFPVRHIVTRTRNRLRVRPKELADFSVVISFRRVIEREHRLARRRESLLIRLLGERRMRAQKASDSRNCEDRRDREQKDAARAANHGLGNFEYECHKALS
jgi:hypothetical protein